MPPMEPNPPPKPQRRFRFSLRTLMIVVLSYVGLWTLTALWGGWQLEQRVGAQASPAPQVENSLVVGLLANPGESDYRPSSGPAADFWAAETTAYAPFVLRINYVYRRTFTLMDGKATAQVRGRGKCLVVWFFGANYCLTTDEKKPLFGRGK